MSNREADYMKTVVDREKMGYDAYRSNFEELASAQSLVSVSTFPVV